jgi:signal transduction histidine kinase
MAKYRLKRYLGMVFIAAVIVPAVILSLVAIRAISHEEAYIEKQMEGTLSAEVAHVSGVVQTEISEVQSELARTIVIPQTADAGEAFDEWMQRSSLVEIPFLLSSTYDILWPTARPVAAGGATSTGEASAGEAPAAESPVAESPAVGSYGAGSPAAKESTFLAEQQAFLENEEMTPVYENIADAYKDEILGDRNTEYDEQHKSPSYSLTATPRADVVDTTVTITALAADDDAPSHYYTGPVGRVISRTAAEGDSKTEALEYEDPTDKRERVMDEPARDMPLAFPGSRKAVSPEAGRAEPKQGQGEETRRQAAVSQFDQSEDVRSKVYEKARSEGQQLAYRNILASEDVQTRPEGQEDEDTAAGDEVRSDDSPVATGPGKETYELEEKPGVILDLSKTEALRAPERQPDPESVGRLRSIFVTEPRSFSEIVAGTESGIIPRMIDGRLELIYWQKASGGGIVGCLIRSAELRDRIVGALPGIYSPVRILTVLDEAGEPLIVPPGHEDLDWQRPFAAQEVSEFLPRWEVASYLTDPNVISSRAQVATSLMWVLIVILFVAILVGGTLVVRSTYAEMRLAQQKTSFVANVSHELKTPLTSIRLFAEMLRDGRQRDKDKQKEYLGIMTAETERLTRLVNNVLDFSKMERGEKRYNMRKCDLVAVATSVVESQRARLENDGFNVVFTTHTGTLAIEADEEALKQALVNLLSNAEKYSSDTKVIDINVRRDNANAVVSVGDRGVGIPPGKAGRIFDEFYRVDDALTSKVKGAGLGLTIARRILRDHDGDLRYSRRDGGGSTFELLVPIAEEEK